MKIVNILGGLGNQMYQFAFYLALSKHFPAEEIKLYTGAYNGYGLHNKFELDTVFGINVPFATRKEVGRLAYPFASWRQWQIQNHLLPRRSSMFRDSIFGQYYKEVFQKEGNCFYDGYWQNHRYFSDIREDILMAFTPIDIDAKNATLARRLTSCNSVSIHVRHGEYLKRKLHRGICGLDYYESAIKEIISRTNVDLFCIFSNDLTWCKENIIPLLNGKEYILVEGNTGSRSYLDLYLMSQCHHNIIAHSSFSWWGAWLNQYTDKIVIGPSKWINRKNSKFELPDEWIKI